MVTTLLSRIAKFYQNEAVDEDHFFKVLGKQIKSIEKMETRKVINKISIVFRAKICLTSI